MYVGTFYHSRELTSAITGRSIIIHRGRIAEGASHSTLGYNVFARSA